MLNTGCHKADMTAAFGINEPAAWLIKQMEGKEFDMDDLVGWLCGEYEVDPETARTDTESLVATLRENSLIVD